MEEGNPGRTTALDDPLEPWKNGLRYLLPCLDSHEPLDLVIIMLGTNDLKHRFSMTAGDVARGVHRLIRAIKEKTFTVGTAPEILIIAPPPILNSEMLFGEMFLGGIEKSLKNRRRDPENSRMGKLLFS